MTHCQTILEGLRRRGYRITPQRELIIQAIVGSGGHMSAEQIHDRLREHTQAINVATVYRTLDTLWQEGYVYRNDLSEGKFAFTVAEHGPHVHLICRRCKNNIDVEPGVLQPLDETLRSRYGFVADLDHISIFGVCTACQTDMNHELD